MPDQQSFTFTMRGTITADELSLQALVEEVAAAETAAHSRRAVESARAIATASASHKLAFLLRRALTSGMEQLGPDLEMVGLGMTVDDQPSEPLNDRD
jgi:hypothetical protein